MATIEAPETDSGENGADGVESTVRRRGRRGGRRRSTAKTGAAETPHRNFLRVNMYAIVKTGGKQYRVQEGQYLLVERLTAQDGESVSLTPLLYVNGEDVVDGDDLSESISLQRSLPTSVAPSSASSSSSRSVATSAATAIVRT